MGGGDLNLKKSWHPVTIRNQERVWKEEQKAKEEARRVEQLRKEIADERAKMEITKLQEQAGLIKPSNRLEWMYSGAVASAQQLSEEREQYLLGTKSAEQYLQNKDRESTQRQQQPSLSAGHSALASASDAISRMTALGNPNANSQRDLMAKVREDPLFDIRRREQDAVKQILDNTALLSRARESGRIRRSNEVANVTGRSSSQRSPSRRNQRYQNGPPNRERRRSRDRPPRKDSSSGYSSKESDEKALEKMMQNAKDLDELRRNRVSQELESSISCEASKIDKRPNNGFGMGPPHIKGDMLMGSVAEAIGRRQHYLRPNDNRWK